MRKLICFAASMLILLSTTVFSQSKREVTGQVTDANGDPLNGTSVKVKNSPIGTSTDVNGFFKINAADNSILVFSSVGYESKELNIASKTYITIQLFLDIRPMNEVVVTGIGVATSKRKLGISVETITADKLPATPSSSIDQALIGKIPGAQISSISGNPGDPINILLRGINTVQGGTNPLILLDGVDITATDLNSLDMTNIEKVEVVQGAASATIYGAQGANGVIQIFTKKGKKGTTAINFSTSYSINNFLNNGNVHKANLHPYLTDAGNNIIDVNTGLPLAYNNVGSIEGISYTHGGPSRYAILDTGNIANKPYNANLKYFDHFKQVFQTGTTINNSLSISGASDKSDFSISVSNNHTVTPVLKSGAVDRSNLTANIGTELFRRLKIRSTTQLIYTKNTLHPELGAGGGGGSLGRTDGVFGFLNTSPFFDLTRKLTDGTYPLYQLADFLSANSTNPYYITEYSSSIDNKIDVIQSFDGNYTVNKFLELDAKYGLDYKIQNIKFTFLNQSQNLNSIYYNPNYIGGYYANDNTGEIDKYQKGRISSNFLGTATIRTDFEHDFHIKLPIQTSTQVSYDYRKNVFKEYATYGVGLPLAPPINVTATSSQGVITDYEETFITYGYLINQKIDFGDFGGITGGFRSDWSSAFGGGSKPFTFPHFDGHLLITSFFKNSKLTNVLPYFKLRAAYGEAGIQPGAFDRYQTLGQQNLGSALVYTIPATTNNPNLQVEVSKEFETGTDFTLNINKAGTWLNAIYGSFTYWKRKSNNVIYTVSIAPSNGSTGQLTNAINMSSNGVQFSLNIPVYNSKNLKWYFTANFGHENSMIDKIFGGKDIIIGPFVLAAGQKIGQLYGYRALTSLSYSRYNGTRYIPKTDESLYTIVDGRVVLKSTKQIQFTDEKYSLGDPNPKFNTSFINSFSYRDLFTLSFQLDWIYGSHLYNQTKEWMYRDGISGDFSKPVTIDGETGAYSAYWSSPYYNRWGSINGGQNAIKDFFYEGASFLRLRNLSLAFDLAKFLKVPYLKKLQLVLTGRNIITLTRYSGSDPEVNSVAVNSALVRGFDHSSMPNIKSYQVGLNIRF
jgi:TonB-dependent starch-binding outer membrane protein SusC